MDVGDIDSQRMLIHIRQGKGKKDRYSVLSQFALEELRVYARKYRPEKSISNIKSPLDRLLEKYDSKGMDRLR